VLERAIEIAEDVLFPAAAEVDRADRVPRSHLDLLADEGFYGLTDADDRIVEVLAGGCLATTFVWLQHHSAVRAAMGSATPGVPGKWVEPLRRGQRRAGVSLAGVWPGPGPRRARRVDGGYVLDGEAPWVTGWDLIDTLFVAARHDDTIVFALLDAAASPAVAVTPLQLVAVQASRTVHLHFAGYFVPNARVTGTMPLADWPARDAAGLHRNGSLALGVAARCCRLIGPGPLDAELDAARAALDARVDVPAARAVAAELAFRAAGTLTVTTGSRAVLAGEHAQRLVREATFLLVFGSRPAIRTALAARLIRRRQAP
jgi:alkylation response protein AidB-like acyl-CoA dehydrogenase